MNQTKAGSAAWAAMEKSNRKIFIYFHTSRKDMNDVVGKQLKAEDAVAETMTLSEYNNRKDGLVEDRFDKDWKFNEKTGEYDKTSEWDNTVMAFDEKQINVLAAGVAGQLDSDNLQDGVNVVLSEYATHEANHTVQKSGDFRAKVKDPKTGKYLSQPKSKGKAYDDRAHEKQANKAGKSAREEMNNKMKNK